MMRAALIIGGSGGIGTAMSDALRQRGVAVTALSRRADGLNVADQVSVDRVLGNVTGPFDLILVATGILAPPDMRPEKSMDQISAESMAEVFAVNAIGPALILRHAIRLVPRDRRSVVAVLTARVGSIEDNRMGGWYSYRASKAAANQIVRTASIEIARKRPKSAVIALHPGTVDTAFTQNYPNHRKDTPDVAAANLLGVLTTVTQEQTGQFFDWAGKGVAW